MRVIPLLRLVVLVIGLCFAHPVFAQLQFFTSPPAVDSFPIVKTTISVSHNGRPAPIEKRHLSILEDGNPITNFELQNCDESNAASIALLTDISGSMQFTVQFNSPRYYYDAFSAFVKNIYAPSEIALIPFNDTVTRVIPASYRSQDFFNAEDLNDTTELVDSVGGLLFSGNTDVDYAIWVATEHLKNAAHQRKVIVLVTDDAIYAETAIIKMLKKEGISLFVLELDNDTIVPNINTANATGGKFFSPSDSTEIPLMMTEIAHAIYAKKCTVRYVSNHPCPWYSEKILWLGLNYQSFSRSETHRFKLGPNLRDTTAPQLSENVISTTNRIVRAVEDFPCTRGIKSFIDSGLVNFAKMSRVRQLPDLAYDSIVVINESAYAHGWYIAIDTNNNVSRIEVEYTPPPDTLDPVWNIPSLKGQQYSASVTEVRKWDKGLMRVLLDPSSQNLKLDSVSFLSQRIAQVYVSIADLAKAASGCIIATDSVGNESEVCVNWTAAPGDERPPVITQLSIASPLLTLQAKIDELQPKDRGIASVSVTPVSNTGIGIVTYLSPFEATVSIPLIDSLFRGNALVVAIDSAGNRSEYLVDYWTSPDVLQPEYSITAIDPMTRDVYFTEIQPWDRGLKAVTVLSSSNFDVNPIEFNDSRHALTRIHQTDPTMWASAWFEAYDSAGNWLKFGVELPPSEIEPELKPLVASGPLDFGTTLAPAFLRQSVRVTNPNAEDVTLLSGSWSGDDSVFVYDMDFPLILKAGETIDLYFVFKPQLLGEWVGTYTLTSDKLPPFAIQIIGQSTGVIQVSTSDEVLPAAGQNGVIRLQIQSVPSIVNLDRLSFTLSVDEDVATLRAPDVNCSEHPWSCNYQFSWAPLQGGEYRVELERVSVTRSLVTDPVVYFDIPFTTHLAVSRSSSIDLSQGEATRARVELEDGSITMGDECADETIRAAMRGELALQLRSIVQASGDLSIDLISQLPAHVDVSVIDMSGVVHASASSEIPIGPTVLYLNTSKLTSGAYLLVVRGAGVTTSRIFEITR